MTNALEQVQNHTTTFQNIVILYFVNIIYTINTTVSVSINFIYDIYFVSLFLLNDNSTVVEIVLNIMIKRYDENENEESLFKEYIHTSCVSDFLFRKVK